MSKNVGVFPGERLTNVLFAVDHAAGDLVYVNGYFGTVEDDIDVSVDPYGTLILNRVNRFARVPSTVAMGTVMGALATEIATTLQLLPYARGVATVGVVPTDATVGWKPVGRTTTTGNASMALIQMLNPNPYL